MKKSLKNIISALLAVTLLFGSAGCTGSETVPADVLDNLADKIEVPEEVEPDVPEDEPETEIEEPSPEPYPEVKPETEPPITDTPETEEKLPEVETEAEPEVPEDAEGDVEIKAYSDDDDTPIEPEPDEKEPEKAEEETKQEDGKKTETDTDKYGSDKESDTGKTSEKTDKADKTDKSDKTEKTDKTDKTEKDTGDNKDSKTDTAEKTEKAEETKEPEKPKIDSLYDPDRIYNYLNGKTCTEEERNKRPVAIMINNIQKCLPQAGICDGDIYYECSAEGGITRIMMLSSDYENLGTVGSVRSSRDYFVDFLANHDALYVHAGGSETAYAKISWRKIDNLDGVNMYTPDTFWRDMNRWNRLGMEHSLMTSGKGIVSGINYKKYRTTLDEKQVPLFKFYGEDVDKVLVGSPAPHVHMKSTAIQTVDFVYDETTGEYLRYQYNGNKHVDENGNQLSVKNVFILFTDIAVIPGDSAGRLSVGTVGKGQGYYITNGKRKVVNWSRAGKTDTLHLEYRNGDELVINSGKTFICVVDTSVAKKIDFEYKW